MIPSGDNASIFSGKNETPILRFLLILFPLSLWLLGCDHNRSEPATPVNRNLPLGREQADSLFKKAELFFEQGKTDTSLIFFDKFFEAAEQWPPDSMLIRKLLTTAGLFSDDFKYEVANRYVDKAKLLADQMDLPLRMRIQLYFELATGKENLLDLTSAEALLMEILRLSEKHHLNDPAITHRAYLHLANISRLAKNYPQAIEYLDRALANTSKNDFQRLGVLTLNKGVFLEEQGKHVEAIDEFNTSIQHRLKLSPPNSERLAVVYLQKAFSLLSLHQYDSARQYLKLNLSIRRATHGEKNVNTFGAAYSLGEFFSTVGDYDSAAAYFHQSLIFLIPDFNHKNQLVNPRPGTADFSMDLIIALVGKARALQQSATSKDHRQLLETSLATYFLADSIFAVYTGNDLHSESMLRSMEDRPIPYQHMVDAASQLYTTSGEDRYAIMAINAMERSRSVLLQSSLSRAAQYGNLGLGAALKSQEDQLTQKRSNVIQRLSSPDLPRSERDSLNQVLLAIDNEFVAWQSEVRKLSPGYFASRFDLKSIELTTLQNSLNQRATLLLEYLYTPDWIFCAAISGDSIVIKKIKNTEVLERSFREFAEELNTPTEELSSKVHFNNYVTSAGRIYDDLVKPFEGLMNKETKSLIITADGPLSTLPFDALIREPVDNALEVDYHLPYLVRDFAVSYAYSIKIMLSQFEVPREGKKLLAMGFAGDGHEDESRSVFANLPGTENEIKAIELVMKNDENNYLLAEEASEDAFKQKAPGFDIIHLAVHGEADTVRALESKLVFRSAGDAVEDGNLFAHELYELDLSDVDLAVLSACESGLGKNQAGEGTMSIARGFAYAGCPSLVISSWKINDKTTAEVMGFFYERLSNGLPLNESLRRAKMAYIDQANMFNAHPAFWAAYRMVGETTPLASPFFTWPVAAGILVLIVILYLAVRWCRRSLPGKNWT